ncbi:MAG TPA: DUF2085 domain-containing protein [Acidobacteriota bacterium]|jgi:uncharacterized membrane protein
MRKLQIGMILGAGLWCLAILLPTFVSAEWIRLFFAPICHQIPERSFWLFGKPLSVCARCSGFYFGFFSGLILHWIFRIPACRAALRTMLVIILVDVANGFLGVYPDLAVGRFCGAFLFSVLVTPFVVQGLYEAARSLHQTEVQIP